MSDINSAEVGAGVPSAASYPHRDRVAVAKKEYMTMFALAMMNVSILAGLANDPQQAFYGLSSITFFVIGAILFFLPTALVTAELATGWTQRGGIFRWVGEGMGPGWGFMCLIILWMQCSINFGIAPVSFSATILFYTPNFNAAVAFAEHPQHEIWIICCWLVFYWFLAFLATKGLKVFSKIAKYGVVIGSLVPLGVMVVLMIVWLCEGHQSNISFAPVHLLPKWEGLSAGVLFSYAGIDMNAAHITELKNPKKEFPQAMIWSMVFSMLIFMVGTLIIAMVIPNNKINVLYALFMTFRELGATIGIPWLYMVLSWALLCNMVAMTVTSFSGPSFMLGQAARAGFLPKSLQSYNKHGMPSRLMYFQCVFMTIISLLVGLLPNVEGFVIMLDQAVTVLYLSYYIIFFTAYLKLKHQQPNRPRAFVIPGGRAGGWITCIVGYICCAFGIVLAIWPPAQVAEEVGSPVTYVVTIIAIAVFIFAVGGVLYSFAKRSDARPETTWVDPHNEFAPFTWQIEGLDKPCRVESDIPSDVIAYDQDPMGTPIKHHFSPDARLAEVDPAIVKAASEQ